MKRPILLTLIALFALMAKADDSVLKVWLSDGNVVSISLKEEPTTTYVDGNLVITTTKTTITYPLEKVRRYTYMIDDISTDINTPKTMSVALSKDGETLTFNGLKSDTDILLYNTAGQLLRKIDTNQQSKVSVTVSDLPTGVYVVKANNVSYKITKR